MLHTEMEHHLKTPSPTLRAPTEEAVTTSGSTEATTVKPKTNRRNGHSAKTATWAKSP